MAADKYSIAHESIETPFQYQARQRSFTSNTSFNSLVSSAQTPEWQTARNLVSSAQTPDWQTARNLVSSAQTPDWQDWETPTGPRLDFSTPTPRTSLWNIGLPSSAMEHAMDMRGTAPLEGWPHEGQKPQHTDRDGLQGDGLDGYMDRRSHISPTPTAFQLSSRTGNDAEECEMED